MLISIRSKEYNPQLKWDNYFVSRKLSGTVGLRSCWSVQYTFLPAFTFK